MSKASANRGGQAALGDIINDHGVSGLVGLTGGTIVIQNLNITTTTWPRCGDNEVAGLIAYFRLEPWWMSLSDIDRGIIEDAIGPEVCREKIHATSRTASSWLRGIAWRICVVHAQLASRLRAKATGLETGVDIDDYWSRQLDAVRRYWQHRQIDIAREELHAVGYRMREENAPADARIEFDTLRQKFCRDDPYYANVMNIIKPIVAARPGVIQSTLAKGHPMFSADQFRYAMYYGEIIGDIQRVKSGRSYALFPASDSTSEGNCE